MAEYSPHLLPHHYILVHRWLHGIARAPFFTYIHRKHSDPTSKPDAMRYQDWDILLYPKNCEVPFKEFKTTSYAVQEGGPASGNGVSTSFRALNECPGSNGSD